MTLNHFLDVSYWTWIGTFYLVLLTWQDFRNNMLVDDRKNYFMYGLTLSLLSHVDRGLIYVLTIVIVSVGLNIVLSKMSFFGEADVNTFSWVIFGFGLLNPYYLGTWLVLTVILTILYRGGALVATKILSIPRTAHLPYYIVILLSFAVTSWLVQLY